MHAEAQRGSRGGVVVYLLPGLTPAQRGAALRRLRQEGKRGCGPRLPSGQLAIALAADRLRAGLSHTTAAVRQHPVGMLLPAVLAAVLLMTFVLASVSARDTGAAPPGARGDDSMSITAGATGRGGPGETGPSAPRVGGQPARTSSAGSGAYAAVVLGPLAGTGAEVAGLAASAGAATAPLPETPPLPMGPPARNTPAAGRPQASGGGRTTSLPSAPSAPSPTMPTVQPPQPVPSAPSGSTTPRPTPDPSASPTSGVNPSSPASSPAPTLWAPVSQPRVPSGM